MTEQLYVNVETKEGLDGMRAKPAMYLGSTGVLKQGHAPRALTQMAQEVLSNSLDEALAGYGKTVTVTINEDQSMTISDNGRGLPKGHDHTFDAVIRSATAPHTSGKFDDANYAGKNTTGTHGIGLKATNAISSKLIIEAICSSSKLDKKTGESVPDGGLVHYLIEFEQAKVLRAEELQSWSKKDLETEEVQTGTNITFWPDDTILESNVWTLNDLLPRLEASAFLFPGVEVKLVDKRDDVEKSWCYERGLEDYIEKMSKGETLLSSMQKPIVVDQLSEVDNFTFKVTAALVYSDDMNSIVETYANGVPTKEGGPHLDGFNAGLLKAINDFATDKRLIKQAFRLSDVSEGLIAALHVQVPSKIFETEGQTKEKLATVQAKQATQQAVYQTLTNFFYDNLEVATEIVEKTESARQAREAAAKSRKDSKASRDAKKSKRLEISSKLKQATSKDVSKRELIITEGDSASNAKRDKRYQAVLGIRGKIRNVFELTLSEALKNEEVSTIIGSIGAGVGSECDPEQSNYGAIMFACFDGETKVKSLDGNSYSFNELIESNTKELWVYSMDSNGRVVPALAKNIRKTGDRSKMVRVTLDNGEVIESTPEHLFMTVDGVYAEAQNLQSGQSLMPLYTKLDDRGYELFYSQADGRYEFTHRMVADNVHSVEKSLAKERLKNEDHHRNHNSIQVHHKDENKRNNLPKNLEWKTAKEHWTHHAEDGERFARYNQSAERIEHLKDLHQEGVYDQSYFGNNGYNGSDRQKNDLKNAHSRGVYDKNYQKLAEYNQSDKHKEVVAKTNASKKHIDSVTRSKILMSVRFLVDHDMSVDEYHYDMYRNKTAMRFVNALEYFGSIDRMIEDALKTEPREFEHAKDFRFSYDSDRKQKNQIAKVVRKILDANEDVTEDRYNAEKGSRTPRFDRAIEKFGSYEELIEYASAYNHKVVSVETIGYDETKPVYCMTVDKYHNFFLDSGVLVKNCDADDDGAHINTLLLALFYKFMRNLITAGKVYLIIPPLYKAEKYVKGKPEIKMYFTEQELAADRHNLSGYDIKRYKGLGEMDKDTEAYDAITNHATRRVVQVTIEDAMRAAQMMKVLMGGDASLRAEWIEDTIDFEEMAYS